MTNSKPNTFYYVLLKLFDRVCSNLVYILALIESFLATLLTCKFLSCANVVYVCLSCNATKNWLILVKFVENYGGDQSFDLHFKFRSAVAVAHILILVEIKYVFCEQRNFAYRTYCMAIEIYTQTLIQIAATTWKMFMNCEISKSLPRQAYQKFIQQGWLRWAFHSASLICEGVRLM